MTMTHYMELLAVNQPWNLIIFMAIPVVLAETIAISELYLLFTRNMSGTVARISRITGIIAGIYFLGVFCYLFATAVVPLTGGGAWRGAADVIAVLAYLLGVVPLGAIALIEMKLLKRTASVEERLKAHAFWVGVFLVVAHVAMIFGMLNPEVLGYREEIKSSSRTMEGMDM